MITPHRRRTLGDVGDERARSSGCGADPTRRRSICCCCCLRATQATLDELLHDARRRPSPPAASSESCELDATVDLDGEEHFGFADGISQPTIDGLSSRMDIPPNTIQPGEFILGYANEYGRYTDRPLLDPSADPGHLLPRRMPQGSGKADLAAMARTSCSASWLRTCAASGTSSTGRRGRPTGRAIPHRRTWLAAKMVGRWPSGAPLTLAPDADDPTLADGQRLHVPLRRRVRAAAVRSARTCGGRIRATRSIPTRAPSGRSRSTDATGCCAAGASTGRRLTTCCAERRRTIRSAGCTSSALAGNISRQFELDPAHLAEQPQVRRPVRRGRPAGRQPRRGRRQLLRPRRARPPALHRHPQLRHRPRRRLLLPARHPRPALPRHVPLEASASPS